MNCVIDPTSDRSNPQTLTPVLHVQINFGIYAQEQFCRSLEIL
uniref:Uncharacterized protein n=1 Tax=Anguilla anguilla TaxID=7936 RepID=A0A0E9UYK4_ANGAN